MIKINFNNKLNTHKYKNWIQMCFDEALNQLKLKKNNFEVNVAFVKKNQIRNLNKVYRNTDKVTDVLSFPQIEISNLKNFNVNDYPHDINMETNNLMLGDIYICVAKVKHQRKEYGTSLIREMCYMATHGILHLFGFDHIEKEDKIIMRKMEEKILGKLDIKR